MANAYGRINMLAFMLNRSIHAADEAILLRRAITGGAANGDDVNVAGWNQNRAGAVYTDDWRSSIYLLPNAAGPRRYSRCPWPTGSNTGGALLL